MTIIQKYKAGHEIGFRINGTSRQIRRQGEQKMKFAFIWII